jgi:hypothetical protein
MVEKLGFRYFDQAFASVEGWKNYGYFSQFHTLGHVASSFFSHIVRAEGCRMMKKLRSTLAKHKNKRPFCSHGYITPVLHTKYENWVYKVALDLFLP